MTDDPLLRIGAVSRATGVAVSTLRSWESRYGLPVPTRTSGGHRLYPQLAIAQVRDVQALIAHGASTGAAAAVVLAKPPELRTRGDSTDDSARIMPLQELLLRTRAAKAENHRLRAQLSSATAAASASLDRLHSRAMQLQSEDN